MLFRKYFSCFLAVLVFLVSFCFPVQAEKIEGLSALSAVLYEPQTGRVIYERDAHTPRSMASTTKIMTALIALERCDLNQAVTVTAQEVRVEGSALGLRAGDQITMIDLITGLLLESGNDAANVIAYTVSGSIPEFAKLMNDRAREIGMKDSLFVTPSGLDEGGHSSSAYDMALLTAEALKNEAFASIVAKQSAYIYFGNPPRKIYISNHNRLLQLYPYCVGVKTGFTKKSGRCLVSAADKDGMLLIAVTLNGGDDWNDHMALYQYGFSQTESVTLPVPDLPKIPIAGASVDEMSLNMEAPPSFTLLKGEKDKIQMKIDAPRFLIAPVKAGDAVGKVEYSLNDKSFCETALTIAEDAPARPVKKGWQKYLGLLKDILRDFLH